MKISHVLASHAKFYTISSFCRCCCENLDEHTVDFHDLFEEGVLSSRRKQQPIWGLTVFSDEEWLFQLDVSKKKHFTDEH